MRAQLALSWAKYRQYRKFLKSLGVRLDSEKRERELQNSVLSGKITVQKKPLHFYDKQTNQASKRETPVAAIENLEHFVSNLLDQYQQTNTLTWHNDTIPRDEVWIKIGGDHGGESFKMMLQVANIISPNAKQNTHLVCIVDCKDTPENIREVLLPMKTQITNLQKMMWNEKKIRLFLFGDYDFLLKMYGISGAQSTHPCLWCKASKTQTQKAPVEQPTVPVRSLQNIKSDHMKYHKAGSKKQTAKAYNNVTLAPVWDIELQHVAPPYLHLLLGITKKHHLLLEKECHTLDEEIAKALAKEDSPVDENTDFGKFVLNLRLIHKKEAEMDRLERRGTNCSFLEIYGQDNPQNQEEREDICDQLHELEEEITTLKEADVKLTFLSGPVTANLDSVLKSNNIAVQAYHGRSFIGNHCHKYMKTQVIDSICKSVLQKAMELTDATHIHTAADDIEDKFRNLNNLFSRVHERISHKGPIVAAEVNEIQKTVDGYMEFFRRSFPRVPIIPKQHILEAHCTDFIRTWGFGLGLHGEQGGEACHATVNQLKRRAWGLRNEEAKLHLIMKEQLTGASPLLQPSPQKIKRLTK